MSTQLDPVTGLPMLAVPDVISQIPLGVQVVPWDDIQATDRPMQGPAYPNDIINSFTWVTGEQIDNPGVNRAGTMTSDRRFRVDATISGGGGSSPGQPTLHFNGTGTNITGNDTFVDHLFDYPLKVYGSCVTLVAEDKPTVFSSVTFELYLHDNRTGSEKALHYITMSYDPATGGGSLCDTANVYWPNGLMFWDSTSTAAGDCNWGYRVRNLWAGTLTAVPLLWAGP